MILLSSLRRLRPLLPSEHLLAMAKRLQAMSRCEEHPVQRGLLVNAMESLKQAWMIEKDREQKAEQRMRRTIRERLKICL